MHTTVILANGAFPTAAPPLEILRAADFLVCCDGAYAKVRAFGREPDYVVGDGDSLAAPFRASLGARFIRVAEQDTNDLNKAFRFVLTHPPLAERLVILGATGLREDHALGNIFLLFDLDRMLRALPQAHARLEMVTDTGVFEVVTARTAWPCRPGEAFSVFAPDPRTRVASEGLVWPLDGVTFANLHCATLNRTAGRVCAVAPDRAILVYRAFPGKGCVEA